MRNWRNLFPHADKVVHFIAGFVIAFVVAFIFDSPDAGFFVAFVAGLTKELYDNYFWNNGSYLDWFATILGGGLLLLIW